MVHESNGYLPKTGWVKQLTPTVRYPPDWTKEDDGIWSCPDVLLQRKHGGYAMNFAVMGKRLADYEHPATTAMFFETDALGIDVIANLAARCGRHNGGSLIAYLDSHGTFRKLGEP